MTNTFLNTAIAELENKDLTERYKTDIRLWAKDKLGYSLWNKQVEIAEALVKYRRVAVKSGHGVGKLLSADTLHLTNEGWLPTRDLKPGTVLFDEQGLPTTIQMLSPVWDQQGYRITFDDGSSVECGEQHEWNVLDLTKRTPEMKKGVSDWRDFWDATKTYTAQELYDLGTRTAGNQSRWRIPLAQPLVGTRRDLPIDPYLFGFWLGDGVQSQPMVTFGETKAGLISVLEESGLPYSIRDDREAKGSWVVRLLQGSGLLEGLKALDVLNNKHIPWQYLTASESQRRALLAGILDADGFITANGSSVGIDMTDHVLAEDVMSLVASLGYKMHRREGEAAYTLGGRRHITGTRYRMNFRPDRNPFRIRNQDVDFTFTGQASRHTQRTIVSIEPTERIQSFCISVDSPRSLYLTGRDLVPTHNSFVASLILAWFVDTRSDLDAVAVSTAPTQNQLSIIWEYLRDHHRKADLPGRITLDNDWKSDLDALRAMGRKPSSTNEHAFQGIHRRNGVLAVIDEATGVPESIFVGVDAITTGKYDFCLAVGNPDDINTPFGRIWTGNDDSWHKITISSYDSPNLTGEEFPEDARGGLVSAEWIEGRKKAWGEHSARFRSKVLGEFSEGSDSSLFTLSTINKGKSTEIEPLHDDVVVLGCDIARFGSDYSVVYLNHGGHIRLVDKWSKTATTETARKIHRIAIDSAATEVRVDGVGVGSGVVDQLAEMADGKYHVISLVGNAASPDLQRWGNARAFWFDSVREKMFGGTIDISPTDEDLHNELIDVQYSFTNRGGVQIESKDDIRKRLGKSPDYADAFIYAAVDLNMDPEDPRSSLVPGDEFEMDYEELFGEQFSIGPGGGW